MRYPRNYRVEGKEVREFKELDDEKALKLVVMIYNINPPDWEGGIARSISLGEYINLLARRKSAYLKDSGIFKVKYDKVDLRKWADGDLLKLYDALIPRARKFYVETALELSEMQNTERIMYLTALSAADTELKRREGTRNAVSVASQILLGALTIALSII